MVSRCPDEHPGLLWQPHRNRHREKSLSQGNNEQDNQGHDLEAGGRVG